MEASSQAALDRPRLAVVYGHRSLDVMQIVDGARGWCDLVWLVDAEDPSVAVVRPILRKFGVVVDALGDSLTAAVAALRPHAPQGIATFYDTGMERVAAIAAGLGLPFHSEQAGRNLEDKLFQREALRAAGLPTPRIVALAEGADRETVQGLVAGFTYPGVLKPRRASGSWHTFPIESEAALVEIWGGLLEEGREPMVLEEYLTDGPAMPQGFEADYISVETVARGGEMTHLAVTGRFPVAPPLRETGFFIPATLRAEEQQAALELAEQTLRALGIEVGCAHTEIKLTPDGPRVIEVNGRIGGGVPDMLRLAAGVDIVQVTMRAALGLPIGVDEMPPTRGVAYRFFYQPPDSARRLVSIDGLEELKRVPGVDSLYLHHPPGTKIDARHGTRSYLFAVVGLAPDYAGVLAVERFLRTRVAVVYDNT
jgi:biotin carboxylase